LLFGANDLMYHQEMLDLFADNLAEQVVEADDTAYQIGQLVMRTIGLIQHLVKVQNRRKAAEMAIDNALAHAYTDNHHLDYPSGLIDQAVANGTRLRSSRKLEVEHPSSPLRDRYKTERLGFAFASNPGIVSIVVSNLWVNSAQIDQECAVGD
jgi:hypothetical protein